jgi:uncharacterized protein
MRTVLVLSGSLVAWSAFANLGLGDQLYAPRNLLLTGGMLVLANRGGLTTDELGLARRNLGAGLRWGAGSTAVVAIAVGAGVALADVLGPVATLLADERAALTGTALATALFVRIPLGTALFEEVAFRGVLRAVARRRLTAVQATLWTSGVFGLWHVAPTVVALRLNDVDPTSAAGWGAIVGAVATTAVAGIVFDQLRARSGSLVAPILAHWATNAIGLLAAAATR